MRARGTYIAVWGDGWNVCTEFPHDGTLEAVLRAVAACERLDPTRHRIYFVQEVPRGVARRRVASTLALG